MTVWLLELGINWCGLARRGAVVDLSGDPGTAVILIELGSCFAGDGGNRADWLDSPDELLQKDINKERRPP